MQRVWQQRDRAHVTWRDGAESCLTGL
jgi:hypothetical protein